LAGEHTTAARDNESIAVRIIPYIVQEFNCWHVKLAAI
jgi:hypothetical protein